MRHGSTSLQTAVAGIVLIRAAIGYFLSKDLEHRLEETRERRRKDETGL